MPVAIWAKKLCTLIIANGGADGGEGQAALTSLARGLLSALERAINEACIAACW